MIVTTRSEQQTIDLGEKIAKRLKPGDLVVILAAREQVQSVEKMFSVHVDIF